VTEEHAALSLLQATVADLAVRLERLEWAHHDLVEYAAEQVNQAKGLEDRARESENYDFGLLLWKEGLLYWQRQIMGYSCARFAREVGAHKGKPKLWEQELFPKQPSEQHLVAIGKFVNDWAGRRWGEAGQVRVGGAVNVVEGLMRENVRRILKDRHPPYEVCLRGHFLDGETAIPSADRGVGCRDCLDPTRILVTRPESQLGNSLRAVKSCA